MFNTKHMKYTKSTKKKVWILKLPSCSSCPLCSSC